jgi:hypothetical protein
MRIEQTNKNNGGKKKQKSKLDSSPALIRTTSLEFDFPVVCVCVCVCVCLFIFCLLVRECPFISLRPTSWLLSSRWETNLIAQIELFPSPHLFLFLFCSLIIAHLLNLQNKKKTKKMDLAAAGVSSAATRPSASLNRVTAITIPIVPTEKTRSTTNAVSMIFIDIYF